MKRIWVVIFVLFGLLCCFKLAASESSDAFLVTIHDRKVKVVAPKVVSDTLVAIVGNKTLAKQLGKIVLKNGPDVEFFILRPNEHRSIDLTKYRHQQVYFVPLSPAFQEIQLAVGKESYEIPSKEQN